MPCPVSDGSSACADPIRSADISREAIEARSRMVMFWKPLGGVFIIDIRTSLTQEKRRSITDDATQRRRLRSEVKQRRRLQLNVAHAVLDPAYILHDFAKNAR